MRPPQPALCLGGLLACLGLAAAAAGEPATDSEAQSQEERIRQLEEKLEVLSEELARTREELGGVTEEKPLESTWGLGPAASKVYGVSQGLSIGGYAEAKYTDIVADKSSGGTDEADFVRAVLYTGYRFTDWLIFNAEFEFEHASTADEGDVFVEFATLDFLIRDEFNIRGGLMLAPLGFLNELHEPPFYFGNFRPEAETRIIPSTFRENGAGIFGRIADQLEYKLYAITSLKAEGFGASGLRGGRQRGSKSLAEDWSLVAKLDYEPSPSWLIGASVMVGETDHDRTLTVPAADIPPPPPPTSVALPNSLLTLWEAHAQYQNRGFHARALFTHATVGNARELSNALILAGENDAGEAVAKAMLGYYGEIAYEVMQWLSPSSGWSVEPFFRFEYVDTQNEMPSGFATDRTQKRKLYTAGVSVKPIPNVVLKLDYRNVQAKSGKPGDEVNVGFGLVF